MIAGATAASQRLVGDLADQDVPECELVAAGRAHQVLCHQLVGNGLDIFGGRFERRDPGQRKGTAKYGAQLQQPALGGFEEIQPCQHCGLHRVGEGLQRSPLRHRPGQLTSEEGVALGPLHDSVDDVAGAGLQHLGHQPGYVAVL